MGLSNQIGASSLIKPGVIDSAATRPASPYEGQMVYQKDTDRVYVWSGAAWVYLYGNTPYCKVNRTATSAMASNVVVTWDTEEFDNDGMFSPSSDTVTIKTAGIYSIFVYVPLGGITTPAVPNFLVNGNEVMAMESYVAGSGRTLINFTYRFAVNDTLKFRVYMPGGAANWQSTFMNVVWIGGN